MTRCRPPYGQSCGVAYGDATGHTFLVSVGVALVGVLAALMLTSITLRTSLDIEQKPGS